MSRPELDGWKEIGRHLNRSPRTVQDWERERGLPVHRRQGSVYAYVDEIEAWKERCHEAERRRGSKPRARVLVAVTSAAALLAVLLTFGLTRSPRLAQARLHDRTLEALDRQGNVLWSHTFPSLFHRADPRPTLLVLDVDRDGELEVVFDHSPAILPEEGGRLISFDQDGEILWAVPHGKRLQVGDREFEPFFGDAFVYAVGTPEEPLLLVISRHATWYPVHMALRRPATGELVDEYWHPGYVYDTVLDDFDGDGEEELLFGGVNNPGDGLGYPALGLMDLPFGPAKDLAESFPNFLGPENARELGYWLLPQPDSFRALRHGAGVVLLVQQTEGRLRASIGKPVDELLHYYLDAELRIRDLRATSSYQALHDSLAVEGFLDHRFRSAELQATRRIVRFETAPDANSAEVAAVLESAVRR